MVNDQIVNYIISWLCYGDADAAKRVAYTADERKLETHDVIIVPNTVNDILYEMAMEKIMNTVA